MKGLLLKDIYNSKSVLYTSIFLILMYTIFSFMATPFVCIFTIAILPIFIISFITAFDLRWNFNKFAVTTQVPRKTIVLSKYIYVYSYAVLVFIISVFIQIIYNLFHHTGFENIILFTITLCFSLVLVSSELLYWFKRKYNVGVLPSLIFILIALAGAYAIFRVFRAVSFDTSVIIFLIVLPVSLILCVLSYLLSVKNIKNAEFA